MGGPLQQLLQGGAITSTMPLLVTAAGPLFPRFEGYGQLTRRRYEKCREHRCGIVVADIIAGQWDHRSCQFVVCRLDKIKQ